MTGAIFFDGFEGLVRIAIVAPSAYLALILFLRIAGKRTLTKLNAFDLVITVALGSTLATQLLSRDVPLADGLAAFAALIGLQWLVTFTSVRVGAIRRWTRSEPTRLVEDGRLDREAMRRERVTESEILQVVRAEGCETIEEARSVDLQTDGGFAVIRRSRDRRRGPS